MSKNRNIIKEKIKFDPDFVNSPKHNNSLQEIIDAYPNGTPNTIIKRVLCLTDEEFDEINMSILSKLKQVIGENND